MDKCRVDNCVNKGVNLKDDILLCPTCLAKYKQGERLEITFDAEESESLNHDSHYSKQAIEPQSVIEQVANNIHGKVTPEQAINILQSLKYMRRLGTKDDVLKEVSKSVNYQTSELIGEWRK